MRLGLNILELDLTDPSAADAFMSVAEVACDRPEVVAGPDALDAMRSLEGTRGVVFRGRGRAYVSGTPALDAGTLARRLDAEVGPGGTWSCRRIQASRLAADDPRGFLRLLLASLPAFLMGRGGASNLMGHLYWRMPASDVVTGGVTDELAFLVFEVSEDLALTISVRTFTRTTLKDDIAFRRRPFEQYPLYRLEGTSLVRAPRGTVADDVFIQRVRRDAVRPRSKDLIDFYTFADGGGRGQRGVSQTKLGALSEVLGLLEAVYGGFATVTLGSREYPDDPGHRVVRDQSRRRAWELEGEMPPFAIRDAVGTKVSREATELVKRWLFEVGVQLGPGGVTLNFVQSPKWYRDRGLRDEYVPSTRGHVVQNVDIRQVKGFRTKVRNNAEKPLASLKKNVFEAILKEVLIKWDCKVGRCGLATVPEALRFHVLLDELAEETEGEDGSAADGGEGSRQPAKRDPKVATLAVGADGSLEYGEAPLDRVEDWQVVDALSGHERKGDDAVCVIEDADGNLNAIFETGLFTVPEDLAAHIARVRRKDNVRAQQAKTEEVSSLLGIGVVREGETSALFFSGLPYNPNIRVARSSNVRRLEALDGSRLRMDLIVPLLDVDFVRLRQLTVVPWPLKYLREFHAMARAESAGTTPADTGPADKAGGPAGMVQLELPV